METREKAVSLTLNNVYEIFGYLMTKPEVYDTKIKDLVLDECIKKVPKCHADLVIALIKLYDAGYENAWKDQEQLK